MQQTKRNLLFALLFSSIFLLAVYVAATNAPNVMLSGPDDGKVFNTTNNITFQCNATSDSSLRKIDLYTTINGSFSKTNTSCFGELCEDASTALLMHFNNDSSMGENGTRVYDWSGNGNNATVAGAMFNATGGRFSGAFKFDGSGNQYITINDSGSADLATSGSIEFWVKPEEMDSGDRYLLQKASTDPSCTTYPSYLIKILSGSRLIELDLNGDYDMQFMGDKYLSSIPIGLNVWSQVVFTWNGSWIDMYINGTRDTPQSQLHLISSNSYNLWIGSVDDTSCYSSYYTAYFNGAIDELAIYNRQLTLQEVSEHYNRTLVNNATTNWTTSNVPDGTHRWNCLAYNNESQANWSAANRTLYVDLTTPPRVNGITLSPNSTDDVDPSITLRVTANITDMSGVGTAVLQYLSPSNFTTNVTMYYDSITKLYNASFTPNAEGVWKYRIWANDTIGNSNTTSEAILPAYLDYTWNLYAINISGSASPDFGTISAPNGTTANMGVAVINNTGDYTLTLDFSSNPAIMSFNITPPVGINAKNTMYAAVYATVPQAIMEWPIQLIVNASSGGNPASPPGNFINGILVPFRGGPYLDASIQNYQATVSHNQEVNLSAKIKNLGNETATEVYANWSLPDGWDVLSGNKSEYLGNIANSSLKWSNITVKINATLAALGTFENGISITATAENSTDTDSKTVSVVCRNADSVCGNGCTYITDNDCTAPSGGGSPGGGGGSSGSAVASTSYININYAMKLAAPGRIDVFRGQKARFSLNVSNAGKYTELKGVTLSITGYPQVLMKIEPKTIPDVAYPKTKAFEVSIDVPNYTRYGEYTLTTIANGLGSSNFTPNATEISATGKVVLAVHSQIENETISLIKSDEELLSSMKKLNITATKIERQLSDAKDYLKSWDYDKAKELGDAIREQETAALRSHESLGKIGGMLNDAKKYGVEAPETQKMYSLSEAAYLREDYARAEERANNALLTGSIEITGRVTLLRFVHEYSWVILAAVLSCAYVALRLRKKVMARAIKRKLVRLEEEEKTCRALISDAKKEYFEKRLMTKSEYRQRMNGYERSLIEAKRRRMEAISKLISWEKPEGALSDLSKEGERIRKTIEEAQRKYFEGGTMTRAGYKKLMHELRAELAEVRMGAETAKEKINGGQKKLKSLLAAILIISMFMPAAMALNPAAESGAGSAASADASIKQAGTHILEMQEMKLGVSLANDTLNEAKILYSQGNYVGAESLARHVGTIKETAMGISGLVDEAETKIYDAKALGLDVTGARKSFDAGIAAFESEDYVGAESKLNSAISEVERVRAASSMNAVLEKSEGFGIIDAAANRWRTIVIFLVATAAIAAVSRKKLDAIKTEKRKKRLLLELAAANKMMVDAQRRYFESTGTMTKSDYTSSSGRYKEKMLSIKKELSLLMAEKQKTPHR